MDVKTGKTTINWDVVLKQPGERHVIFAYNTKSYWPMSLGEGGTTARGLARRGEGRAKREPDRAKPQKKSSRILNPHPTLSQKERVIFPVTANAVAERICFFSPACYFGCGGGYALLARLTGCGSPRWQVQHVTFCSPTGKTPVPGN